ncbi:Autophagy protein 5 [Collariella sp. IMI 366227]|nr:Autophagy protein 5 [Collariella sp. IMI 366227]
MASPSPSPVGSLTPGTRTAHRRPSGNPGGPSSSSPAPTTTLPLPQTLWTLQIPLHITHATQPTALPFIVTVPRFSYLAFLLPRLAAYYGVPCSSFHHEGIHLRNLAVGLLVDLYQPETLPWRLEVGDGPEWDIADTFTNAAKEADFVRNGNAKQIMNDYASFNRINTRLLNTPTPLKNVPIRIYIPSSPHDTSPGSFKVVQTLVPPRLPNPQHSPQFAE